MGLLTDSSKSRRKKKEAKAKQPSSWDQIKNLLTCKQIQGPRVHDPSKIFNSKLGSSCSSVCSFNDVVHGNTRVVHRSDHSPESTTGLLHRPRSNGSANYTSSSSRLRKLSGCYECHAIVDPGRQQYSPRTTICCCSQCGEIFTKIENLETHQAVRHAVSELDPEDSGRNIVEIIFKSSWLNTKGSPICKIERILKVHNTPTTIQRFEDCRDAVKARALGTSRKNPRCAADGNELLRFHCAAVACQLGARGSASLCGSAVPGGCGVCAIIRHGFEEGGEWVRTTASSGRAHESLACNGGRRAMLVCRVIAGRVRRVEAEDDGAYDSVAGGDVEELMVCNPKAILPCFVVIYKPLQS